MRAAVLDQLGPDVPFRMADLPTPHPGQDQVRVRVEAVGVNPADVVTRLGMVALDPPARFPLILGWDAAGVVDAVGDGVTERSVGDAVICFSGQLLTRVGTYADHVVLDVDDVAARPPAWTAVEAATLPSSGLTALQALVAAKVTEEDQLVVVGAAGMVGGLVTEVAAARGARVIAVVSAADTELARRLGAHEVIDRRTDVPHRVHELAPGGADVAVCAARDAGQVAMEAVRDGGRCSTVADMPPPSQARGIKPVAVVVQSDGARLRELSRLAGSGAVTARVSQTLPLDHAARAHDLVLAGGLAGKVVLQVEEETT